MGFAIDPSNGKLTFPRQTPCGAKFPGTSPSILPKAGYSLPIRTPI